MKKIHIIFTIFLLLSAGCGKTDQIEKKILTENIKEFTVTAKQFVFEPTIIEVNKGDKVKLIVTSTDLSHGFSILEYGINERVNPGESIIVEFIADKEGEFTMFCSVYCGENHSEMKGKLIVK